MQEQHEVLIMKHRMKANSLTPGNLEPKAKNKEIKEISVLTRELDALIQLSELCERGCS